MSQASSDTGNTGILLTTSDIRRAVVEGAISQAEAESLLDWASKQFSSSEPPEVVTSSAPEDGKGFNLVTVTYYFGAMLMISACAWFLGDKWDLLGSRGILITTVVYLILAASLGVWLRGKGYIVGGGLLIIVAVCLIPLITYSIEDLLGLWPGAAPGSDKNYYPLFHGSWIVMELATIAAAAIALRFVRFGFLTAPMAFSFWFFSMDIAALIIGDDYLNWNARAWVSVIVGLLTLIVGYGLDKTLHKPGVPRSEDFAFWCYFFGLLAFWGGLTALDSDSERNRVFYLLLNLGLMGIALKLKRAVFLVFGAVGVHLYLGHLAYQVFKNSFLFPFALALLGLSLILVTVLAQRHLKRLSANSSRAVPSG
jgi:hypothetical protein